MDSRRNIIMLAVLLGLGAYIYFVEFAKQEEAEEAKKLLQFDPDAVTNVALVYPDREIELKKDDEKWHLTKPISVEAEMSSVEALVKAVNTAEVSRTLEEPQGDMALYGLNEPVVKVQLTLKDGTQLPQIAIGKDTPVGHSVYVQKANGKEILLTPQVLRLGMTKETKDLRNKTVVAFQKDEVSQIEIRRPQKPGEQETQDVQDATAVQDEPDAQGVQDATDVTDTREATDTTIVLRKVDGDWTLDQPVSAQADAATVSTFLSSLSSMRAQDFIEEPLLPAKEFGLDPPQLSVVLTLGDDGRKKTILVGSEKSTDQEGVTQRHVKREDAETLYLVGDWTFRDLNKTASDFRDKTVAHFAKDTVVRVEVKRQDGEGFLLTKGKAEGEEATWQIDTTQEGMLKDSTIAQFVTDMHELNGFEIAADNPDDVSTYGLQDPLVTIRAYNEAEEKLAGVIIGQTTEGDEAKIFTMAEDGQTVFGVRDYVFDRLNKKPVDFWEKLAEEEAEGQETKDATNATGTEAAAENELAEEQM
jgi:hypothetical protein